MTDLRGSYNLIGPPGTGKTTSLSAQVRKLVEEYGSDSVLIASLTRAAAAEIAGRHLPIPRQMIGTLHAHCYHALGCPELTESKISEWNREGGASRFQMTESGGENIDDAFPERVGRLAGDEALQEYQLLRVKMIHRETWPVKIKTFAERWENWKNQNSYYDFVDLIDYAYTDINHAPGNPSFLIVDEAQDLDLLSVALIRKWSEHVQATIYAGDPWQTIYDWRGSDPCALDYIQESNHVKVLEQSYRLPRAVHRYAMKWMEKHLYGYKEIQFKPRDEEGSVEYLPSMNYKTPLHVADLAGQHTDRGKSVMVLGTCSYHVYDIVAALKHLGIPFKNPFRSTRGDWNPLSNRGTSMSDRFISFFGSDKLFYPDKPRKPGTLPWSIEDLKNFTEIMKSSTCLKLGAKKSIALLNDHDTYTLDDLSFWFTDEALAALLRGDVEFLSKNIIESKQKQAKYPLEIICRYGVERLVKSINKDKNFTGMVCPGTIHSVKGAEASVVIICPDISQAAYRMLKDSSEQKNSVIRLFYVGMTRAKEELILLGSAGNDPYVPWPSIA